MKDLKYYQNLPYEIIIKKLNEKDGEGYFVRYKDFPYIMGDGKSKIEALNDVQKAFASAIKIMLKNKDFIKEPKESKAKKTRINISLRKNF